MRLSRLNTSITITILMICCSVVSCTDDNSVFVDGDDGTAKQTLTLSTVAASSRADGHYGDDPYGEGSPQGEEHIATAEIYFFTSSTDEAAAFYHESLTGIDRRTTADITVHLPIELTSNFIDGQAYAYVLANLPSGTSLPTDANATLEKLQQVWVGTGTFVEKGIPASFVMRGGNTVTLSGTGKDMKVTGYIPLERLASKIRLFANIHEKIYLDENGKVIFKQENESESDFTERREREKAEEWESRPTTTEGGKEVPNVWLYISNVAQKGRIDGFTGYSVDAATDTRETFLNYGSIARSSNPGEANDPSRSVATEVQLGDYSTTPVAVDRTRYPYTHSVACYSYPNQWNSTALEEKRATFITVRIPWERTWSREDGGEGSLVEYFYYQIPVNRIATETHAKDCLTPNTYYRIKIDIGMLGAKDTGEPLEVDASYEAVPWSVADVDVSIKDRRYLVVNQPEWVMNNISIINIPFSSSHDVEVVECYVNYFRYNDIWGRDNDTNGNTTASERHNSTEFTDWLEQASSPANNIKDSEGEISLDGMNWGDTGQTLRQMLYYKKDYFYDKYYDAGGKTAAGVYDDNDTGRKYGTGFKYYVGHEHPKTFQKTLIKRPTNLRDDGWDAFETKYQMDSIYHCYIDNESQTVIFKHPLVWWKEAYSNGRFYYVPEMKNGRLRDEYSRCEIIIKIRQIGRPDDEHLFEQTIYITQYPGMYVEVSHDYGDPVKITSGGIFQPSTSTGNQYVLVNGHTTETDETRTDWYEVSSYMPYFGYINYNPNMYVIHTTQLSEENVGNYIIGDPRSLYYNNQLGSNSLGVNERLHDGANIPNNNNYWTHYTEWLGERTEYMADAPRMYEPGNNGRGYLKYYYPSDETDGVGTKENFIAPSFRVASSFGKVSLHYSWAQGAMGGSKTLDIESWKEARRRCAVYQEAGRPAGRWRTPTMAEIDYVMQLSIDGKIPHLFGLPLSVSGGRKEQLYYSSTGLVGVNITDKEVIKYDINTYEIDQSPAVRCVYDDWYWIKADGTQDLAPEAPITTTFYWGDKPKDNPQN